MWIIPKVSTKIRSGLSGSDGTFCRAALIRRPASPPGGYIKEPDPSLNLSLFSPFKRRDEDILWILLVSLGNFVHIQKKPIASGSIWYLAELVHTYQ